MPRKKRPPRMDGPWPLTPRLLPGVGADVVHIQVGRRVVTVELPPRGPRGSEQNLLRTCLITAELRRRAILARERPAD